MTSPRARRVEELFDRLVDEPPAARRAILDSLRGEHPDLVAEVAALLDADAEGHPMPAC